MTMQLWTENMPYYDSNVEFIPYLTPYIVEGARLGVVVCAGGGYELRADYEGNDYGEWLNSIGVSALVLEYRVAPYKAPAMVADAQRAIRVARRVLREHGAEKIGIMGSSAGGHLAAIMAVHHEKQFYEPQDEVDQISARPDFAVLCYPVIDMYEFRHDTTRTNLIGRVPKKAEKDFYSAQLQVTDTTPPAFLWHTANDEGVAAVNSMLYATALAEHHIPYELHIYPDGPHGMALAMEDSYVGQWKEALKRWLDTYV